MQNEEKKEEAVSEERPLLTPEEAQRRYESCVLAKLGWNYKPDSFAFVPKETKVGDVVVVDFSDLGFELAEVKKLLPISSEKGKSLEYMSAFDEVSQIATEEQKAEAKSNLDFAKRIAAFTQKRSDEDNLNMKVLGAYLSLDQRKVLIEYTSDGRVDFRNLLKVLAAEFHLRIEFRQLFSRDVAKQIGGLGICGLPICCKTFLTSFTSTTINMAKNQYLTLNIPKLSGACGRLMCCLAYENDAYTSLRADYPKQNANAIIDGKLFKVVNLNVLSDTITATDGNTYINLTSKEWKEKAKPVEASIKQHPQKQRS